MQPFGKLSRIQKVALFEAWIDGRPIAMVDSNGFICYKLNPQWCKDTVYLVDPKRMEVDWSAINPAIVALAKDEVGLLYGYYRLPYLGLNCWKSEDRVFIEPRSLASYKPGNMEWQNSLILRPDAWVTVPDNLNYKIDPVEQYGLKIKGGVKLYDR